MPKSLQLDLPLLLPDLPDVRDACVHRLTKSLESKPGVKRVHVIQPTDDDPSKLCIHYDAEVLPLHRIRTISRQLGAEITDQFGHVLWDVQGLLHQRKARNVISSLQKHDGVLEAEANAGGPIRIEFDRDITNERELRALLDALRVAVLEKGAVTDGVVGKPYPKVTTHAEHVHRVGEHAHGGIFGERTEITFAVLSGVCVGLGWIFDTFTDIATWVPFLLFFGAYVFGGWFTLREAVDSIRAGRFEIDFLMLVAAVGAAAIGAWPEGALLLFLFSTGHALEGYAMGRARKSIESLGELAPKSAVVRRNGNEEEISVEGLAVGDTVLVKTNERLPADGFVVKGTSAVNQAPVTGESVPVEKWPVDDHHTALENPEALDPSHRVFAGSINGGGALEIIVTKKSTESTLARVVQMVAEAETARSPTQRFTDRFERVFVPAVLVLVGLLLFAWVVVDETVAQSFYRAMAVLVAASPCALAIATPSAVLSGVARAGLSGVLIKGGGPLENLGTLSAMAFDKTGTITTGRPHVTDVLPHGDTTVDELLQTIGAVEKYSDHPLAQAVVRFSREHPAAESIEEVRDMENIVGRGIRAMLGDEVVYVGKDDLFSMVGGPQLPESLRAEVDRLEADGRTTIIVRLGDRYLGLLGLMDTHRAGAKETIARLRQIGVRRMVMISGDNQLVANAVARQVGLNEAYGNLLPEDKVETIRNLSRENKVAMVGDGVNDAPAMANATVGIAMGVAGSDVALETADVALMADDLEQLTFAVALSHRASGIIRQNLWLSLGMVVFLVPATILGLGIGPAVALHEGSTLVVVVNALRLLAFRHTSLQTAVLR
ncbi:MAG: heavy metal translocating P-type ATPase [Rhodothermia bacterium]|nr:MAG: heavy metal translocating P-type ATPase [Rhodothermia bacterium]